MPVLTDVLQAAVDERRSAVQKQLVILQRERDPLALQLAALDDQILQLQASLVDVSDTDTFIATTKNDIAVAAAAKVGP